MPHVQFDLTDDEFAALKDAADYQDRTPDAQAKNYVRAQLGFYHAADVEPSTATLTTPARKRVRPPRTKTTTPAPAGNHGGQNVSVED